MEVDGLATSTRPAPPKRRGDVLQDVPDHMRVVVHVQRVRYGDEPGVGGVTAEVEAVVLVHEWEDTSTHRHPRCALVGRVLPRLAICLDLLALLNVQRLAALVVLERSAGVK